VGVSFAAIKDGGNDNQSEEDLAMALIDAAYGKPATMEDYTQLLATGRPLPSAVVAKGAAVKFSSPGKGGRQNAGAAGRGDEHKSGGVSRADERKSLRKWKCGQFADGKICGWNNFPYANAKPTDTTLSKECFKCKLPRLAEKFEEQASAAINATLKENQERLRQLKPRSRCHLPRPPPQACAEQLWMEMGSISRAWASAMT
jgi:hypothetical protein